MWRGLRGGINFYWRILVMSNYNITPLTRCIEEKLRNSLGYSIRSSYPDREGEYDVAREYAEGQCRVELGLGPRNPRAPHQTMSRLGKRARDEMNNYMARLIAEQEAQYRGTYNRGGRDLTLRQPGAKTPEQLFNPNGPYSGPAVPFSGFGGRSRTRRRRTTKKRTRKQRRNV